MSNYSLNTEDMNELESFFSSIAPTGTTLDPVAEVPPVSYPVEEIVSADPETVSYTNLEDFLGLDPAVLNSLPIPDIAPIDPTDEEEDDEDDEDRDWNDWDEDEYEDNEDEYEDEDEEGERVILIPENSPSILLDETTSRFSGAIWYDAIKQKRVVLAGVGGIGSYVAFMLSRVSPMHITLYDDDKVDTSNLSGQLFDTSSIGTNKTVAMSRLMASFSDYYGVNAQQSKYTSQSSVGQIMICGFDNMDARKIYFNNWKTQLAYASESTKRQCLFIDGRLAAEDFQVICVRGDDTFNIERYEREFLFDSSEVEATVCSYKQTSFMANMIGSIITNLFVNFVANECEPLIERDLPFLTEYNAELMYFNTER